MLIGLKQLLSEKTTEFKPSPFLAHFFVTYKGSNKNTSLTDTSLKQYMYSWNKSVSESTENYSSKQASVLSIFTYMYNFNDFLE